MSGERRCCCRVCSEEFPEMFYPDSHSSVGQYGKKEQTWRYFERKKKIELLRAMTNNCVNGHGPVATISGERGDAARQWRK